MADEVAQIGPDALPSLAPSPAAATPATLHEAVNLYPTLLPLPQLEHISNQGIATPHTACDLLAIGTPAHKSTPNPVSTSPLRSATFAAVREKQQERQANMIKRWAGSGKTVTFTKGSHVSLRLPGALLHGVDVTKAPCLVLEEVRPQYYRLLHPLGVLQGLYRPGDLQPLKGHTFPLDTQAAFESYEEGTLGAVSIGAVVRGLTGEWQIGPALTFSVHCQAGLLPVQRYMQHRTLQMQESWDSLYCPLSSW